MEKQKAHVVRKEEIIQFKKFLERNQEFFFFLLFSKD